MAMMRIGSDDEDSEESDGLPALVSSDDDERLRNYTRRNNQRTDSESTSSASSTPIFMLAQPGQGPGQGPTRNEPISWTCVQCDNCTEIAGRFKKDEPNKRWLVTLDLRSAPNMIAKSFSVVGQTDTWAVQWIKVNRKCCRT